MEPPYKLSYIRENSDSTVWQSVSYVVIVITAPAKRSFSGVYGFQHVRDSEIPLFRHSVNI